ncbi:BKRB2 protein, partial [Atractosteus spatula]|nr:BKRB2 protein [Atractosteus spatula]
MVSCLPFWAITVANMFEWHFGHSLCQFINVGISMNMYCSIYFLVLVSIDRYLALVKTMSHGRMRSVSCAKISCFTIWMFGFIMSIPVMLFRTLKYFPEYNVTACYLEYPSLKWETSYNLLLSLIGFFIPLLIISYCTYKIIEALRNKKMHKFNTVKTEGKASFLVLSVLLVFFLCWIPFHSTTFLHILFNNGLFGGCVLEVFLDISNQVSSYLAYSNSCLNPVLYVIVGKNFRKKAKEVIEQMFFKRGSTNESSRSQHNLIINIVGFLIPLVVISFCSYQIIQTLKKNEMKQFSAARTERKASILILAVVLVFLVCWVPFHIVMLLDTLFHYQAISGCHWEDILDVGEQISTYLAYSNSSLNPILYVIVGKQFRKKAKGLFRQISSWDVKGKVSQVSKFTSTLKYFESTQV